MRFNMKPHFLLVVLGCSSVSVAFFTIQFMCVVLFSLFFLVLFYALYFISVLLQQFISLAMAQVSHIHFTTFTPCPGGRFTLQQLD
jgi:hypothetical protein